MALVRLSGVFLALILTTLFATASSANPTVQVVLGKKHLMRYGRGWGTAYPRRIDNGGDPSGDAFDLRWSGWGRNVAYARGLTWINTPRGGYYSKPGAVELRAYRIGRCVAGGPRAYTRLQVRAASKPGGRLGRWSTWGRWHTTCRFPS
jgi:hypothetical protein